MSLRRIFYILLLSVVVCIALWAAGWVVYQLMVQYGSYEDGAASGAPAVYARR